MSLSSTPTNAELLSYVQAEAQQHQALNQPHSSQQDEDGPRKQQGGAPSQQLPVTPAQS